MYNNDSLPPPNTPRSTLEELLKICTKEAPFKHIDGNIYQQKDGIAMGSPLGCVFANFYMAHVETVALSKLEQKPTSYGRYIDDIIVVVENQQVLNSLEE